MVLYILYFQNTHWIKIGLTRSLLKRFAAIERNFDLEIDFKKSHIINGENDFRLRNLEKYLLDFTQDFAIKCSSLKKKQGYTEFRRNNCINLIMQYVYDQRDYNIKYKVHTGIDICGNYDSYIPKIYFPHDYRYPTISGVLFDDLENYASSIGRTSHSILNEIIYEKLRELGLAREDRKIPGYESFYKI